MIEHLSGTLLDKTPTRAVISAGGVGYGVLISLATYEGLPEPGQQASVHTYLSVREDALVLFGFASTSEREMFTLLVSVTGVGPKTAIGVLSAMGVDMLKVNIMTGNAGALTTLPGLGKKTADRLVLELRDKIAAVGDGGSSFPGATPGTQQVREDAMAAMIALGYNRAAAEKAIRSALKENADEPSVDVLLKSALRFING